MVYISCKNIWEIEFDNIVSMKDKAQDINFNHLKLGVHDTFNKDEKITTKFEAIDDKDVKNKAYPDKKFSKLESQISDIEENYNDFKILSNKQTIEEVLVQKVVKTTIQILYDKG